MRLTAGRLLVTVLLVQACATGAGSRSSSASRTMISSAEIAASGGTNAQEIVDRLRPEWLLTRGDASISGDMRQTLVYLNDQRYGTVAALRDILLDIKQRGVTVLLVEQKLTMALEISDTVLVMGHGRIVYGGTVSEFLSNSEICRRWLDVS